MFRTLLLTTPFCCALLAVSCMPAAEANGADAEGAAEATAFFETHIRPALLRHCADCHSARTDTFEGNFSIDTRQSMRAGGDSGPAIVPFQPDESLLWKAISYDGSFEAMPPDGKLPEPVLDKFRQWIEMGAADPRDGGPTQTKESLDLEAGRQFWAFQPVQRPEVPATEDREWPLDPIDHFVLEKLEAADIAPVADASRHTWLRRATLDLLGRPPTIDELETFLSDDRDTAYEHAVDSLLQSPQFGQRWGRHWLDLAQYADSFGTARYLIQADAWRYRDYVVDSFNGDKPYDQFVREQIAGDLMPAESVEQQAEQIIATGFLAIGAWPAIANDMTQQRADIIDHQIDKTGRAFLGLTLGCARCHDHKFDPIPQSDYYALGGILRSTLTSPGPMGTTVFTDWLEVPLPETDAMRAARQQREAAFTRRMEKLDRQSERVQAKIDRLEKDHSTGEEASDQPEAKKPTGDSREKVDMKLAQLRGRLESIRQRQHHLQEITPPLGPPTAIAIQDRPHDEIGGMPLTIRGSAHQLGQTVSRGLVTVALTEPPPEFSLSTSGRLELANFLASADNPLTSRVMVNRIWHHMTGVGIVPSVDNFGQNGKRPTHPELLDYLASEFVDSGWSIKTIIRRIALSHTYRLSAEPDPQARRVDPDNQLRWRMNRVRLDADAIRDSMLLISDELDPTIGGKTVMTPDQAVNPRAGDRIVQLSDGKSEPSPQILRRRTIDLPIYRRGLKGDMQMLTVFDFADANMVTGDRSETIVPTQTLYLMNSPFVLDRCETLADRLLAPTDGTDRHRVDRLYQLAYSRRATASEADDAVDFVNSMAVILESSGTSIQQSRRDAWVRLCQTVLASNEFLFRE